MNKESPITSFTLGELITLAGGNKREGALNGCIAADSQSQFKEFQHPFRIDAFIFGVCTEGQAHVRFNLHEYQMQRDSMFIFTPNNILEVPTEEYFKAHVVAITPEFMRRVNIDIKNMMPLFLQFSERPCVGLTPTESQSLRGFIALIERELQDTETSHSCEIISNLISAMIYKIGDILQHYLSEHPAEASNSGDRSEAYFRQFIHLLGEHYRQERSVSYYARQLCITPKYLTTIIKRISGKSVSDWVDDYVILEAKTLLKHAHMSVQEIAYHLNFPNQSFFGSYFKRNTGMSPSQYKGQNQNG